MRTRNEINVDFSESTPVGEYWQWKLFLEVLLDIRDLLANPPMEINGVPLTPPTAKAGD